ncbi:MAG: hypothetical protein ACRBN8_45750 [Nannocystales bacterium]
MASDISFACWADQEACGDSCEARVDANGTPLEMHDYIVNPCESASAVGSCSGWLPSREVDVVSGVYEINETFAESLAFNSSAPLWSCDDAKLVPIPGGFEVADANSGELLYAVGLRNGDKVQSINGQDVTTWGGAEKAFNAFLSGTSSFNVTLTRGSSTVNLTWTLVR